MDGLGGVGWGGLKRYHIESFPFQQRCRNKLSHIDFVGFTTYDYCLLAALFKDQKVLYPLRTELVQSTGI